MATETARLTKQAVIKSINEFFARTVDQNNPEAIRHAHSVISQWKAMPASEVIAEAESVFGMTRVSSNGEAY